MTAPATTLPIAMDGRRWSLGRGDTGEDAGRRYVCIELRSHDEEIACARALAQPEGKR